ncbi:MAG: P1 family peptidase [Clostridia bacterium]|nr:P1 family peptidase [Clostridia bacterium]
MEIVIPRGIEIGHAQDEYTGVTAILAKNGAVAGVDVRGGAPGTRETDLLKTEKTVEKINAVVLAGGSAYGLAASCGVMDYLKENKIGYAMGKKVVPIVSGAVIYDLNDKEYHYPDQKMGYLACQNADREPSFGQVGAGKGATVGKLRGFKYCCKSGIGAYTVKAAGGLVVTAIVVVNAFGDVVDETGKIIAGAKGKDGFIDTEKTLVGGDLGKLLFGTNTTIGCVLTNAKIDKRGANKIASVAHYGLARSIRPVHTDYDGDTLFCMSTAKVPVLNFAILQSAAVLAVENAVRNAVQSGIGYDIQYTDEE